MANSEISPSAGIVGANPANSRPFVGRTSILILSAFLFGAASSRLVNPELHLPILVAAGLGVFVCIYAACIRETKRRHAVRVSARSHLENRVERHVAHITEAGPHGAARRRRDMESQYLTVVMRQAVRKPR